MKRTYQPSKVKRNRKFGFRARMATRGGRLVLKRRRAKGRYKLTVSDEKKPYWSYWYWKEKRETDLLKTGRFTRVERVKRSDEIKTLFRKGQKVSTQGAKLFYLRNDSNKNRIAFVLPRGYGNAVQRNRSKRLSREAYRYLKSHLNTGYDLLLFIYPGNDTFPSRCEKFRCLCQKAGLLKK